MSRSESIKEARTDKEPEKTKETSFTTIMTMLTARDEFIANLFVNRPPGETSWIVGVVDGVGEGGASVSESADKEVPISI